MSFSSNRNPWRREPEPRHRHAFHRVLRDRVYLLPIITAVALRLCPSEAGGSESTLLFKSDFSPENTGHNPLALAPGWSIDASGGYPRLTWKLDPSQAATTSNGYFMAGQRAAGSTDILYLQSDLIWTRDLKGREYRLTFDFKVGESNSGVLDFRLASWVEGTGWQWRNLRLFDQGQTLGDPGVTLENTFESLEVGQPDAHGWRAVTVTGIFESDSQVRAWVAPWTFGDASTAAGHFSGSWGIDNLSLSTGFADFLNPVAIELIKGIEVEFFGEAGTSYRIESSTGEGEWHTETTAVPGAGALIQRYFPATGEPRIYRVVSE